MTIYSRLLIILFVSIMLPLQALASTAEDNSETSQKERLVMLQRHLLTLTGQKTSNLVVQTSYVRANVNSNLYKKPGSKKAGVISRGTEGEVVDGPKIISDTIWWKVQFMNGKSAWLKESQLERIPSVTVPIDYNLDGVPDTNTRLIGEYDSTNFSTARHEGYVSVYYTGDRTKISRVKHPQVHASLLGKKTTFSKSNSKNNELVLQWFTAGLPADGYMTMDIETERTKIYGGSIGGSVQGHEINSAYILGIKPINLSDEFSPDPGEYRTRVVISYCSGYRPHGCHTSEVKKIAVSNWIYYVINE
jgi:hypothetical protein